MKRSSRWEEEGIKLLCEVGDLFLLHESIFLVKYWFCFKNKMAESTSWFSTIYIPFERTVSVIKLMKLRFKFCLLLIASISSYFLEQINVSLFFSSRLDSGRLGEFCHCTCIGF